MTPSAQQTHTEAHSWIFVMKQTPPAPSSLVTRCFLSLLSLQMLTIAVCMVQMERSLWRRHKIHLPSTCLLHFVLLGWTAALFFGGICGFLGATSAARTPVWPKVGWATWWMPTSISLWDTTVRCFQDLPPPRPSGRSSATCYSCKW